MFSPENKVTSLILYHYISFESLKEYKNSSQTNEELDTLINKIEHKREELVLQFCVDANNREYFEIVFYEPNVILLGGN